MRHSWLTKFGVIRLNQLVFFFLSRTACRSPVARCPMPIRYSAAFSADTKQQAATLRNTRESKSRRLAKFRHNVRRCKGRSAPPYESCFQNDSVAHGCDLSCPSLTRRPPKVVSNGAVQQSERGKGSPKIRSNRPRHLQRTAYV